eukprot:TRINITY_DN10925_c0_g1_i1.p1 TRINITY_DN10925_c0_g1~~TRINITY_DN10925_c0_g1_i1.p1  ORF type:complete len:196 (+),score=45.53 TRINITY_DN10925_c0_g1_i1:116-703(+)
MILEEDVYPAESIPIHTIEQTQHHVVSQESPPNTSRRVITGGLALLTATAEALTWSGTGIADAVDATVIALSMAFSAVCAVAIVLTITSSFKRNLTSSVVIPATAINAICTLACIMILIFLSIVVETNDAHFCPVDSTRETCVGYRLIFGGLFCGSVAMGGSFIITLLEMSRLPKRTSVAYWGQHLAVDPINQTN